MKFHVFNENENFPEMKFYSEIKIIEFVYHMLNDSFDVLSFVLLQIYSLIHSKAQT